MTDKKRTRRGMAQSPGYGFGLGALWLVITGFGWARLIIGVDDGDKSGRIFSAVISSLAAIVHLGSAIVQLRRKRRDPT